jgi:uncharacterized protein (UPF0261 family)
VCSCSCKLGKVHKFCLVYLATGWGGRAEEALPNWKAVAVVLVGFGGRQEEGILTTAMNIY